MKILKIETPRNKIQVSITPAIDKNGGTFEIALGMWLLYVCMRLTDCA